MIYQNSLKAFLQAPLQLLHGLNIQKYGGSTQRFVWLIQVCQWTILELTSVSPKANLSATFGYEYPFLSISKLELITTARISHFDSL